ncbi:MAG: hypothetical protein M0004_03310 [Actinomycetota bacterium]|nr:hypothetical protein [Actinomycetota bacterium]
MVVLEVVLELLVDELEDVLVGLMVLDVELGIGRDVCGGVFGARGARPDDADTVRSAPPVV